MEGFKKVLGRSFPFEAELEHFFFCSFFINDSQEIFEPFFLAGLGLFFEGVIQRAVFVYEVQVNRSRHKFPLFYVLDNRVHGIWVQRKLVLGFFAVLLALQKELKAFKNGIQVYIVKEQLGAVELRDFGTKPLPRKNVHGE